MRKALRLLMPLVLLASFLVGCGAGPAQAPEVVRETVVVKETVVSPAEPAAGPVSLEVLAPVAQASGAVIEFAKRVDTLEGKTVALHWNGKPGGEYLLYEIKDQLAAKYSDIKFVEWPKGTAWKADVQKYMKDTPADVAILSVGD